MSDRFGVSVGNQITRWFDDEFREDLETKYGEEAATIAVLVLPPVALHLLMADHFAEPLHELSYGDPGVIDELLANIVGKFNFTLRTGLPSSMARTRPDLVEPGDFPWAGAQIYRGYPVGVSALNEESDVWVGERVVDELITLRASAGQRAIDASKGKVRGWQFLHGNTHLLVPEGSTSGGYPIGTPGTGPMDLPRHGFGNIKG